MFLNRGWKCVNLKNFNFFLNLIKKFKKYYNKLGYYNLHYRNAESLSFWSYAKNIQKR